MATASAPAKQSSRQEAVTLSPFHGMLSYLVPGLGQIVQGRVAKGLLFMVCIYTLFFYGMYIGSGSVTIGSRTYRLVGNVYLPDTADGVNTITVRQLLDSELIKKAGLDKALANDEAQKGIKALGFDPQRLAILLQGRQLAMGGVVALLEGEALAGERLVRPGEAGELGRPMGGLLAPGVDLTARLARCLMLRHQLDPQSVDGGGQPFGGQPRRVLGEDPRLDRQEVAALPRPFAEDVVAAAAEVAVLAGDPGEVVERGDP